MPAAVTISTRNESGKEVMIDQLSADEMAKNVGSSETGAASDQDVRFRVSDTGQSVIRIDAGRYRIEETGETLIEP